MSAEAFLLQSRVFSSNAVFFGAKSPENETALSLGGPGAAWAALEAARTDLGGTLGPKRPPGITFSMEFLFFGPKTKWQKHVFSSFCCSSGEAFWGQYEFGGVFFSCARFFDTPKTTKTETREKTYDQVGECVFRELEKGSYILYLFLPWR